MAVTSNVLTGLGSPLVYRQMSDIIGIITTPRSIPKCLLPGPKGYNLGLHNREFYSQSAYPVSGSTYYVRIVPRYSQITDVNGDELLGTPTTVNTTKGDVFTFLPFPDGYPCDSYDVWAGTDAAALYLQGTLTGRFTTTFTVGTTWTLSTSGAVLSAQTIGPPAFASCVETYETSGTVDSRVFLGGGQRYTTGYAQVAKTTAAPTLTCGVTAATDKDTWDVVTTACLKMRLAWYEDSAAVKPTYDEVMVFDGIDLSSGAPADMAAIAALIQAAVRAARGPSLYCGPAPTTTIATWTAITDGAFDFYVNGVLKSATGIDFSSGVTTMANVATKIQTVLQAIGGTCASMTCTYDTTNTRFILKPAQASPTAQHSMSYLFSPAAGTGTDISSMMDGKETDAGVTLMRHGKEATTEETVTWSTNHFIVSTSKTGYTYRFGWAETAPTGTDIGATAWMNMQKAGAGATYVPGATAKRTVTGTGTDWGEWADGMKFRIANEEYQFIVDHVYEENYLYLDSDYSGSAFFSAAEYSLIPYSSQVYASTFRNPFKYEIADITQYPTVDNDEIVAIKRQGTNVAVIMRHHIWVIDGVDITTPTLISNVVGAPHSNSICDYDEGLAIFTGKDFVYLKGGTITRLDEEGKMGDIISRLSANFTDYHCVYDCSEGRDLIYWFVGLDSSYKADHAIVYEPKTGNFWLRHYKDANASAIIRDSSDKAWMMTGNTYDDGHSIPAYTFLHGKDYKNDGASQTSTDTRQGVINSVGSATTTAGYLTCGKTSSTASATWVSNVKTTTPGYFSVTIDDVPYNVGPVDCTGDTNMTDVAASIQDALQTATGSTETVAYSTDHFVVTSATTTNRSNVSYLRPYIVSGGVDITTTTYMNGREDCATKTYAVTQRVLNLYTMGSGTPVLNTTGDAEKSVWLYVCDTNFRNGQWARVVSNTATAVTVTPNYSTTPAAGWFWFLGGIVPSWMKWFDWGSPQHRHKTHGVAVTVQPGQAASGNTIAVHGYQDLDNTVRTTKLLAIGAGTDTTQTVYPADQITNQTGIKIMRPSSEYDLKIDDITISHRARV